MDPLINALGWRHDIEDRVDLEGLILAEGRVPCSTPAESTIPDNLDLEWFIQAVQGVWPFCHAFMRVGIFRILYWLATKGKVIDISEYYAAITDMKEDGDDSRPSGASIGGSLKASINFGEVLETLMPFPPLYPSGNVSNYDAWCQQHYSNKISEAVKEDAKLRGIKSIVPGIRSYNDLDRALVSGRTVVGLGMDWTSGWDAVKGVDKVIHLPSGRYRGGHALMVFGWKKIEGRRWPILHNSHESWGVRRRAAVSPETWNDILQRSRYGAYAVTNIALDEPEPTHQPWDWLTVDSLKSGIINPFGDN